MFRALFSIGKTYLTVKMVELIAEAFRKPKPRQAKGAASRSRTRRASAT